MSYFSTLDSETRQKIGVKDSRKGREVTEGVVDSCRQTQLARDSSRWYFKCSLPPKSEIDQFRLAQNQLRSKNLHDRGKLIVTEQSVLSITAIIDACSGPAMPGDLVVTNLRLYLGSRCKS